MLSHAPFPLEVLVAAAKAGNKEGVRSSLEALPSWSRPPSGYAVKEVMRLRDEALMKQLICQGADFKILFRAVLQPPDDPQFLAVALKAADEQFVPLRLVKLATLALSRNLPACALHLIGLLPRHAVGERAALLRAAARTGVLPVVQSLLAQGVSVESPSPRQYVRPLHEAAAGGRKEVAECLLAAGADVHARDAEGNGVLHRALDTRRGARLVAWWVAQGADASVPNRAGRTPSDAAQKAGRAALAAQLESEAMERLTPVPTASPRRAPRF